MSDTYKRIRPSTAEFLSLPARMQEKIALTDGDCWEWIGSRCGGDYGHTYWQGTTKVAHRVIYKILRGDIPDALQLDHLCRFRACVNPDHLEPVTARENNLRSESLASLNARKRRCLRGHPFTPENTSINVRGQRVCLTCSRIRDSRRRPRVR